MSKTKPATNSPSSTQSTPATTELLHVWANYDPAKAAVVMSNALAEILPSRLNLHAIRILLIALSAISKGAARLPPITMELATYRRLVGLTNAGTATRDVREALDILTKTPVPIPGPNGAPVEVTLATEAALLPKGDAPEVGEKVLSQVIRIRLNERLAPHLLELTGFFVMVPLAPLLKLRSKRPIALALLLLSRRRQDATGYEALPIRVKKLYETLLGASHDGEPTWGTFHAKVLRPALASLHKTGLLGVTYEARKDVRNLVTHVDVTVRTHARTDSRSPQPSTSRAKQAAHSTPQVANQQYFPDQGKTRTEQARQARNAPLRSSDLITHAVDLLRHGTAPVPPASPATAPVATEITTDLPHDLSERDKAPFVAELGAARVAKVVRQVNEQVKARANTSSPIRSPIGYLRTCLEKELAAHRAKQQEVRETKINSLASDFRAAWTARRKAAAQRAIHDQLSEEERDALVRKAADRLAEANLRRPGEKIVETAMIRNFMVLFVFNLYPHLEPVDLRDPRVFMQEHEDLHARFSRLGPIEQNEVLEKLSDLFPTDPDWCEAA